MVLEVAFLENVNRTNALASGMSINGIWTRAVLRQDSTKAKRCICIQDEDTLEIRDLKMITYAKKSFVLYFGLGQTNANTTYTLWQNENKIEYSFGT